MSCPSCGVDAVGYRICPGCGAPLASAQDLGAVHGALLPARAWELTGPESYLLRYVGSAASERGAYKVALMELVARRVLRLDGVRMRRRVLPGTQTEWLLSDGPRIDGFAEPSLARVLALYARLRERQLEAAVTLAEPFQELEGVRLVRLARAVPGFWKQSGSYLHGDLATALEQRGLLSARNKRTPAGDRADAELGVWLALARRATSFSRDELRAYLRGAGASVLLVSTAYPALTQFGGTLARAGTGDQAFAAVVGPQDDGSVAAAEESDLLDFSGLELASSAGFDGSLGVIDAGFIQTGGDGGGGDGGFGGV